MPAAPAWGTIAAGDLPAGHLGAQGAVQLAGDLGRHRRSPRGAVDAPERGPLPLAQGGTGQATQQTAMEPWRALRRPGTTCGATARHVAMSAIQAADLPAATTSVQGAVILDGTASDIQPIGVAAAGAKGQAADAKHVHPYQPWQFLPESYGAKGDGKVIGDAVIDGDHDLTEPRQPAFTCGRHRQVHHDQRRARRDYRRAADHHHHLRQRDHGHPRPQAAGASDRTAPPSRHRRHRRDQQRGLARQGTVRAGEQLLQARSSSGAKYYMPGVRPDPGRERVESRRRSTPRSPSRTRTRTAPPRRWSSRLIGRPGPTPGTRTGVRHPERRGHAPPRWSMTAAADHPVRAFGRQSVAAGPSAAVRIHRRSTPTPKHVDGMGRRRPVPARSSPPGTSALLRARAQRPAARHPAPTGVNGSAIQPT